MAYDIAGTLLWSWTFTPEHAAATLLRLRIQKPLRNGEGGPFGRGLAEVVREVAGGPSEAPGSYSLALPGAGMAASSLCRTDLALTWP